MEDMNFKEENGQRPSNGNISGDADQSGAKSGNDWDEERLEEAMKTLKEMHIQVSCSLYSLTQGLTPYSSEDSGLRCQGFCLL
jgi:hypothetical protein